MSGFFKVFKNESFFCGVSGSGTDFSAEAGQLIDEALSKAPAGHKPVWFRFHLSDIANQEAALRNCLARRGLSGATACVGQAPACGARAGLEAYFVSRARVTHPREDASCVETSAGRVLFFNTPVLGSRGSGPQMTEEFAEAEKVIASFGGRVADNLQRTWIYCRDIDNNYAGLVAARREFFAERGLVPETHFIASTGIEGSSHPHDRLVRMDSLALFGHRPEQIRYLHAPEHLSPTHVYGVTFERGTRIVFGDRSHLYISGTASIDREGRILYERDVVRQTRRLLENVEALLQAGESSLDDICQAVIYLRDPADYPAVRAIIDEALPEQAARLIVRGSVCRPAWLVEMDAIAVSPRGESAFAPFTAPEEEASGE
ncbi:MAG: hypothetical protein IJS01_01515 [Lentisphaeria bacterium]|nr:hypothetical protein [Lentisphaeria bacterium]